MSLVTPLLLLYPTTAFTAALNIAIPPPPVSHHITLPLALLTLNLTLALHPLGSSLRLHSAARISPLICIADAIYLLYKIYALPNRPKSVIVEIAASRLHRTPDLHTSAALGIVSVCAYIIVCTTSTSGLILAVATVVVITLAFMETLLITSITADRTIEGRRHIHRVPRGWALVVVPLHVVPFAKPVAEYYFWLAWKLPIEVLMDVVVAFLNMILPYFYNPTEGWLLGGLRIVVWLLVWLAGLMPLVCLFVLWIWATWWGVACGLVVIGMRWMRVGVWRKEKGVKDKKGMGNGEV